LGGKSEVGFEKRVWTRRGNSAEKGCGEGRHVVSASNVKAGVMGPGKMPGARENRGATPMMLVSQK